MPVAAEEEPDGTTTESATSEGLTTDGATTDSAIGTGVPTVDSEAGESEAADSEAADLEPSSSARYRSQRRGGKGLRDIKTTSRNGQVIGIVRVTEEDELMMMTARGKIQRIAASDISVIGRNTQGVRIMSLDEGDILAAVVRVPRDESDSSDEEPASGPAEPAGPVTIAPPSLSELDELESEGELAEQEGDDDTP
jgi:DNA gyrase subunit A